MNGRRVSLFSIMFSRLSAARAALFGLGGRELARRREKRVPCASERICNEKDASLRTDVVPSFQLCNISPISYLCVLPRDYL